MAFRPDADEDPSRLKYKRRHRHPLALTMSTSTVPQAIEGDKHQPKCLPRTHPPPTRPATCPPPTPSGKGFRLLWNYDLPVNPTDTSRPVLVGTEVTVASPCACANSCSSKPRCDYWSWDGPTQTCQLRGLANAMPEKQYHTIFKMVPSNILAGGLPPLHADQDIWHQFGTPWTSDACISLCMGNSTCQYVAWAPTECWLKSGVYVATDFAVGLPDPAVAYSSIDPPVQSSSAPTSGPTNAPSAGASAGDSKSNVLPAAVGGAAGAAVIAIIGALLLLHRHRKRNAMRTADKTTGYLPASAHPPAAATADAFVPLASGGTPARTETMASGPIPSIVNPPFQSAPQGSHHIVNMADTQASASLPLSSDMAAATATATPPSYAESERQIFGPNIPVAGTATGKNRFIHPYVPHHTADHASPSAGTPSSSPGEYLAIQGHTPANPEEMLVHKGDCVLVQSIRTAREGEDAGSEWAVDAVNITRGGKGDVPMGCLRKEG
ncbi:uncharacterized protein EV422DRAFT_35232 [Fimicolochytrium jonesii]|uniref:uncharacterized protein n=1 Tax=Fimicolochytrium jonesii TaxID=1396493 RepID=UPI0022FE645F|nr:uncharacterized protein EV422DRAFT_35232 [Fimicolochytrium jonesii]KAI8821262.1 hypothetical protein EV422DRAFT_35232 [Fimicolochytrium jonesii]